MLADLGASSSTHGSFEASLLMEAALFLVKRMGGEVGLPKRSSFSGRLGRIETLLEAEAEAVLVKTSEGRLSIYLVALSSGGSDMIRNLKTTKRRYGELQFARQTRSIVTNS